MRKKDGDEGNIERKLFHHFIDLQNDNHRNQSFGTIVQEVFTELDKLLADGTLP